MNELLPVFVLSQTNSGEDKRVSLNVGVFLESILLAFLTLLKALNVHSHFVKLSVADVVTGAIGEWVEIRVPPGSSVAYTCYKTKERLEIIIPALLQIHFKL